MIRTRNHNLPKPDKRGRVRPHVGVRSDGAKARIEVGNIHSDGQAEMQRRLTLIRSLYEGQCRKMGEHQRREGIPETAWWSNWTLQVAKRIGKGKPITETFIAAMFSSEEEPESFTSPNIAGAMAQLRSWGIPVEGGQLYEVGLRINQQQIEEMIAKAVQNQLTDLRSHRGSIVDQIVIPDPMSMAETATFHEAVDAFDDVPSSVESAGVGLGVG